MKQKEKSVAELRKECANGMRKHKSIESYCTWVLVNFSVKSGKVKTGTPCDYCPLFDKWFNGVPCAMAFKQMKNGNKKGGAK